MSETLHYVRCKGIVLQKAREYREKNREKVNEYHRNRYRNFSPEEQNKRVEKHKEWFNSLSKVKQDEMRRKAREYAKNRYHNHLVAVNVH